jgi:hypothetical protein
LLLNSDQLGERPLFGLALGVTFLLRGLLFEPPERPERADVGGGHGIPALAGIGVAVGIGRGLVSFSARYFWLMRRREGESSLE